MEWDVRGLRHIPVQPDAPPSHEVINSLVKAIRPLAATSTSSFLFENWRYAKLIGGKLKPLMVWT